jgi:hypothetical protein
MPCVKWFAAAAAFVAAPMCSLLTAFGVHPQTIFRLAGSLTPGLHGMSGHAFDLRASLVNGALQQLADLPLAAGDAEGSYVSRFTPGAEAFRVLVTGKDADGFSFQRMSAPLVTPTR